MYNVHSSVLYSFLKNAPENSSVHEDEPFRRSARKKRVTASSSDAMTAAHLQAPERGIVSNNFVLDDCADCLALEADEGKKSKFWLGQRSVFK